MTNAADFHQLFTAKQVASLMEGLDLTAEPSPGGAILLLIDAYEEAFINQPSKLALKSHTLSHLTGAHPLPSIRLQEWKDSNLGLFVNQKFYRPDIERWLQVNNFPSAYSFKPTDSKNVDSEVSIANEPSHDRRQRRYQLLVDHCKLTNQKIPKTDYERMPQGVTKLANDEQISRQAFTQDVKKYINQKKPKIKDG